MNEKGKSPSPSSSGFVPNYPDVLKTYKDEFGTSYVMRDADGNLECNCSDFAKDSLCRHVVDYAKSGKGIPKDDFTPPKPLYKSVPDVDVEDEPEYDVETHTAGDSISKKLFQVSDKLKQSGKADKAKELHFKVMQATNKDEVLKIINQYDSLTEDIYEQVLDNFGKHFKVSK